uniref:Uncharacterized protein n=1 Tax=Tanacetum cinerariifolium TaxID=118510 RepID=A0A6L2MW49_TANCI|nr:hypothetical protein [Tanacetum cinerariifolium]
MKEDHNPADSPINSGILEDDLLFAYASSTNLKSFHDEVTFRVKVIRYRLLVSLLTFFSFGFLLFSGNLQGLSCTADAFDEYLQMSEHTARDALFFFNMWIIELYMPKYLRKSTSEDVVNIQQNHNNVHGFPGMLESIDCMHWEWKNCPVSWQGQYGWGDKKYATIMLEAVDSQDFWIWHAFYGIACVNNDINVLDNSPLFDDLLDDLAHVVSYVVNGVEYHNGYYLAYGIYPEWANFVRSFTVATDPKHTYFKQRQESARKDVERAFGVLQGRWGLIQQPARAYEVNTLQIVNYNAFFWSSVLEDISYLFHRLQSLLPVKDSARTCVLSKSWLQAWSTIPILRFLDTTWLFQEQGRNYSNVINCTLVRYHKENIPIESIDLTINIKNQELASLAEKWVHFVASKSTLKELYLRIRYWDLSFLLTSEIFSSGNLITASVKHDALKFNPLWITDNPNHVNCVSRAVPRENKPLRFNHLRCLREVKFESGGQNNAFEIIDVPSLKLFSYDSPSERRKKPPPFSICSLGSITELYLDGVVIDASLFHIIESKLPFLESLTLDMRYSQAENLDITSVSLKRITLKPLLKERPVYIQVNAPKLLYFCYGGWNNIASLLFTTTTPENITIILTFAKMVDHHSFLI